MATSKKKKVEAAPAEYTLTVQLGSDVFSGAGATPLEALQSTPKPLKIMAKGIVTTTFGDMKKVQLMTSPRVKRVFYNGTTIMPIIAKQLFMGLK